MSEIKFKIYKFNPEKDKEPFFKDYNVELPDGTTVLDALNIIKWTVDGTLTFRMSCRSAICGSCAMKINGRSMLACNTQVKNVLNENKELVIEPLGNLPVIKDLIVDLEPFWSQVEHVMPWLVPASEPEDDLKERFQSNEDFHKINDSANCIMCASCYSDCSVLSVDEKFVGPTALAKAQRFVDDSRDSITCDRVKELSKKHGIWDCTHCFECVEACPKGVKPLDQIVKLRTSAMKHGNLNNNGARHAMGFYKLIKHSGLLDENKIPIMSINIFNVKDLLGLMPIGLRMLFKGKLPPIIHKPIDNHEEVRAIFDRLEKD